MEVPPSASIREYRRLFGALEVPDIEVLTGVFSGELLGPAWLRRLGEIGLGFARLRGWCGKRFMDGGQVRNLVDRAGESREVLPGRLVTVNSRVDERPSVALTYPAGTAFPWPLVRDEMRAWGPDTLLCMVVPAVTWLPAISLPFLLRRA